MPSHSQSAIEDGETVGEIEVPKVRGFALQPTLKASAYKTTASYEEKAILSTMVNPCAPSCQKIIIRQMEEKWNWKPGFMNRNKGLQATP